MALSGASDILELYALADACDVEIRIELNDAEMALVSKVTDAINRACERTHTDGPSGPSGAQAA